MFKAPHPLKTPVLLIIFNRLDTTKQVFEAIQKAKPPKLYIAADGPRTTKHEEEKKVHAVRKFIIDRVDWDCEVQTLFRNKNLGCKYAVSGAINWFFEHEEQGIILEDDCLPSQSFFWFCEDLLNKFRDDKRIFIISGYNKQEAWKPELHDYFYSHFGGIWGWASWRRAWEKFDLEMETLDEFSKRNYFKYLLGEKLGRIRQEQMMNSPETTWDFPWGLSRHINSGLACVPSKSLIKNIGFGEGATHTLGYKDKVDNYEIEFPLKDNNFIVGDMDYDKLFHQSPSFFNRVINKLKTFALSK